MKKLIPLLLSIIIIGILVYSYINDNSDFKNQILIEEEIENAQHGDTLIVDDPRTTSVYKLKGKKELLNYLDPSEMNNYEDLVTLYITFLLNSISNNPSDFYKVNSQGISDYLGIYDLNDFLKLHDYLIKENITTESKVKEVELVELKKEGNLLNSKIKISFDDGNIAVNHYINYVYINNMDYLFLYSNTLV